MTYILNIYNTYYRNQNKGATKVNTLRNHYIQKLRGKSITLENYEEVMLYAGYLEKNEVPKFTQNDCYIVINVFHHYVAIMVVSSNEIFIKIKKMEATSTLRWYIKVLEISL